MPLCLRRGKKKLHTLKSSFVIDAVTKQILATTHTHGRAHDLTLLRAQNPHLRPDVWIVADSGYGGLATAHPQTCLSRKKPRGKELSPDDKAHNRSLGRFRMPVEHLIRSLKIWHIVKETYRDRRKRFSLRSTLIAGLVDAGLQLGS